MRLLTERGGNEHHIEMHTHCFVIVAAEKTCERKEVVQVGIDSARSKKHIVLETFHYRLRYMSVD